MKMISSTSSTSISGTTFTSALKAISPRRSPPSPPPRLIISDQPFPGHRPDQLVAETLELTGEQPDAVDEQIVGDHRRNGGSEAAEGGHQRLGNTGRDRGQVARAAGGDADEGVHDAYHGAEQADQ